MALEMSFIGLETSFTPKRRYNGFLLGIEMLYTQIGFGSTEQAEDSEVTHMKQWVDTGSIA